MKIIKLDVKDGLGEIEVAVHSHIEASRLTAYLNEAAVALATTQALVEQEIETAYQYWNHWAIGKIALLQSTGGTLSGAGKLAFCSPK